MEPRRDPQRHSLWTGPETDEQLLVHWRRRLRRDLVLRRDDLAGREEDESSSTLEDEIAFFKLLSIHDVLVSGLDPGRERTFRARTLLTIRCPGRRGHLLARVHATRFLPVLVPAVGNPTIPGFDVRDEWDEKQTEEHLTEDYGHWMDASKRAGWFCGYWQTDDDVDHAHIPGVFALHPRDFSAAVGAQLEPESVLGFELLCRCGWRGVALRDIEDALAEGRTTIAGLGAGHEYLVPGWYDALPYPYRL